MKIKNIFNLLLIFTLLFICRYSVYACSCDTDSNLINELYTKLLQSKIDIPFDEVSNLSLFSVPSWNG